MPHSTPLITTIAVALGLALILVGNLVMFARPEQWFLRRRLA